jgi:hypothetical protein
VYVYVCLLNYPVGGGQNYLSSKPLSDPDSGIKYKVLEEVTVFLSGQHTGL